ncbi:MAG: hypothetical protein A3F13_07025 [Gammaproteobacteria bacterium RIFCSPHIGHO2_12_FULL_40_19]|nr:MAG: hypothetical protein A3F13_07025 [Gammaproteobacteria bacterium RIFCSPHIGHO2_12_FULL_40_19]
MKYLFKFTLLFSMFIFLGNAYAFSRGIYITQSTAEHKAKLAQLIAESKKYGIDTFIIDVNIPSKAYTANVKNAVQQGIHYVARIVIFPHGGTHAQVTDKKIWAKRLALAKYAVGLGATAVQLDYIRFRSENPPSPEKAKRILTVVQYFKDELAPYHVSVQMDIFGIATIKPAHTIGQDVNLLASVVDAFCPMVYPSHYEPFRMHAVKPYETVFNAITALKKQLNPGSSVSVFAYIELFNYRFPLSAQQKMKYINAEMKAAHDAGANGWYVWSATNHYSPLFRVLAANKSA